MRLVEGVHPTFGSGIAQQNIPIISGVVVQHFTELSNGEAFRKFPDFLQSQFNCQKSTVAITLDVFQRPKLLYCTQLGDLIFLVVHDDYSFQPIFHVLLLDGLVIMVTEETDPSPLRFFESCAFVGGAGCLSSSSSSIGSDVAFFISFLLSALLKGSF
jgi:hypothetical protein